VSLRRSGAQPRDDVRLALGYSDGASRPAAEVLVLFAGALGLPTLAFVLAVCMGWKSARRTSPIPERAVG
jgi:hypothetical protein